MRAFTASVIGAAIVVATQGTACADGPPELDVSISCRAAARGSVAVGTDQQACLNDERTAKDALAKDWSSFSALSRTQCVGMNRTGGPPSYVELLVCLEIMRDAGMTSKSFADGRPLSRADGSMPAPASSIPCPAHKNFPAPMRTGI
jgi:hypothetical protein